MEEYIGRFLALGRSDKQPQEPFNLCHAVDRAVLLVRPMARHAQVHLQAELPTVPLTVLGNANDVSQLVVNLLLNAVEATATADASKAREVKVQVAQHGSLVSIAVCDPGPGPATEIGEQLFEPLVSNKRDGIGLGLSVAKSVAGQHGGTIGWERVEGTTCFRVELPLFQSIVR
jgi:C4-dicarboxylate-specific signal transduction histidine kinase